MMRLEWDMLTVENFFCEILEMALFNVLLFYENRFISTDYITWNTCRGFGICLNEHLSVLQAGIFVGWKQVQFSRPNNNLCRVFWRLFEVGDNNINTLLHAYEKQFLFSSMVHTGLSQKKWMNSCQNKDVEIPNMTQHIWCLSFWNYPYSIQVLTYHLLKFAGIVWNVRYYIPSVQWLKDVPFGRIQ